MVDEAGNDGSDMTAGVNAFSTSMGNGMNDAAQTVPSAMSVLR